MKQNHLLIIGLCCLSLACSKKETTIDRGNSITSAMKRGGQAAKVLREETEADGAKAFADAVQNAADQAVSQANPYAFDKDNYKPKKEPMFNFEAETACSDAELANYWVELDCSVDGKDVGKIALELWPQKAPKHVRRFLRHCDEGFYDGTKFHRIVREFMVQGGDPTGSGAGDGPHGNLDAEFSKDAEWSHGYGVLSMARGGGSVDSASCQFFICNAETPSVWNLDGNYSSFGRMTAGVNALEAMSDAPTIPDGRENSKPKVEVLIKSATVMEGEAPRGEKIERPQPDLGGEPAIVEVRHVLISFAGANPRIESKRTRQEAEALVADIVKRARAGEDLIPMLIEHSDDPVRPGDKNPGIYKLLNTGAFETRNREDMAILESAQKEWDSTIKELQAKLGKGEITQEQLQTQANELRDRLMALVPKQATPRTQMVSGFSDLAFKLEVGEIQVCEYDKVKSPFGFHIMKRLK